jgi:hypothetical protein
MALVMSRLSGWLGVPYVSILIKAVWRFPTHLLLLAEKHGGIHVNVSKLEGANNFFVKLNIKFNKNPLIPP